MCLERRQQNGRTTDQGSEGRGEGREERRVRGGGGQAGKRKKEKGKSSQTQVHVQPLFYTQLVSVWQSSPKGAASSHLTFFFFLKCKRKTLKTSQPLNSELSHFNINSVLI